MVTLAIFIALLGVPFFILTTSVHRADLPVVELKQRTDAFDISVAFKVPIYLNTTRNNLLAAAQSHADDFFARSTDVGLLWGVEFRPYSTDIDSYEQYVLTVVDETDADAPEPAHILSPYSKGITVVQQAKNADSAALCGHISEVLFQHVFGGELATLTALKSGAPTSDMSFPYSSTYHVVFNLLAQDGTPVAWEIERAVAQMQPVFNALRHYTKFEVSTLIQYYSKLTHSPQWDEARKANVLLQDSLSTFINFGDWNLINHERTPVINFVIYFADLNYRNVPLLVEGTEKNVFSIPQWGAVHIYNPQMPLLAGARLKLSDRELNLILDSFASQLFELLGVPSAPVSPLMRIDAFQRVSTYKQLKRSLENLAALVKLSNLLLGISIPEATKNYVLDSLAHYDAAVEKLRSSEFGLALESSGRALQSSDKAFFEKEMVQQAHFPNEHKLAVFLPLLAPICSIVFFGIINRAIAWKKKRDAERERHRKKKEL